ARLLPGLWISHAETGRFSYALAARLRAGLADGVGAHTESLGVEAQGALPRGAGQTTLVVGLGPRKGLQQVGLADAAQNAGHHDVGYREIGAGDPLAVLEAALETAEPAAG